MKALLGFLLVLLIIGVGLRVAGMRIPVLDYPLGGPMAQPRIEIVDPDLNLP
jgi:Na+/citrate or Na+/malate symporter